MQGRTCKGPSATTAAWSLKGDDDWLNEKLMRSDLEVWTTLSTLDFHATVDIEAANALGPFDGLRLIDYRLSLSTGSPLLALDPSSLVRVRTKL